MRTPVRTTGAVTGPGLWPLVIGRLLTRQLWIELYGLPGYAMTLKGRVAQGFAATPRDFRPVDPAIGKALPQRRNIVITRSSSWQHQGVFRASNLLEAFDLAGAGETYVIGGGQIYALALAFADRAVVTEIELDVPGDAYFPELPKVDWHAIGHIKGLSSQGLVYRFIDYRRTMT
ncbi:MAG: hypothetical protein EBX69_06545 [Betaproteobacteria bacterium]|nr:hypothetical protein [Betaproteobacteria bacterium]